MKRTAIASFVLLCSFYACGNRNHESMNFYNNEEDDIRESKSMQIDSLKAAEFDNKKTNGNLFPTSACNSLSNSKKEIDNMRGFDPVSEDDMDDNGMSRFMENDDDEGWD
jgi:hypothetical protein